MRIKLLFVLTLFFVSTFCQSAFAQVLLEGKAAYSGRVTSGKIYISGSVSRISNYLYQDVPSLSLVIALSTKKYAKKSVTGITLAKRVLGPLGARTYWDKVAFSGAGKAPKSGTYYVLFLLIDTASNHIWDGGNFNKRLVFKNGKVSMKSILSIADSMSFAANRMRSASTGGKYIEAAPTGSTFSDSTTAGNKPIGTSSTGGTFTEITH